MCEAETPSFISNPMDLAVAQSMTTVAVTASDGFSLAVQDSCPEDAPALLLLAGQAKSHLRWRNLRGFFEGRFRVLTFDYRGTGGSRGQVGAWSTGSFAADAAHVVGKFGIRSTTVYGTSMGGRVAQTLAIDHPDLVIASSLHAPPRAVPMPTTAAPMFAERLLTPTSTAVDERCTNSSTPTPGRTAPTGAPCLATTR